MPILERLNRRNVAKVFLWDVVIVNFLVLVQSLLQILGGIKMRGGKNLADPPVESFHHAIGLRVFGFGQTVFNAFCLT